MDLLCVERMPDSNFAKIDPVMFEDFRVVKNMLNMEENYLPSCNYFRRIQNDIQPFMRKLVTTWMLEVCEEQKCEDQIFPLAVNFLDRFLCQCRIAHQQLQLLGATTLLIASKIRQCRLLPVDLLCAYTDNSITPSELRSWEMLVLSKLRWNITAITGFDYVDHVIERVSWGKENAFIRRHSHTLVAICYTEPDLMLCRPSVIASACICAASRGLNIPSAKKTINDVCKMTNADIVTTEFIISHIERVVAKESSSSQVQQTTETPNNRLTTSAYNATNTTPTLGTKHVQSDIEDDLLDDIRQPETPTDVQDIHF